MFKTIFSILSLFLLLFSLAPTSPQKASAALLQEVNIKTLSNLQGKVGESFSATFSASGGFVPYTWEVISGSMPPGLSLTKSEQPACSLISCGNFIDNKTNISGTPTSGGSFQFTIKATDARKLSGSSSFVITIAGPPAEDPQGTVDVSVSTDRSSYIENETIGITISALNNSGSTKVLRFLTGCQTSYTIGSVFSDSSIKACTEALTQVTLLPREIKVWNIAHDLSRYPVLPGTYELQGSVIGYGKASTTITIVGKTNPLLSVTSPKASDIWEAGKTYNVSWLGATSGFVTISLSKPLPPCLNSNPACAIGVPAPFTITSSAINNGIYNWTVPHDMPDMFYGEGHITVSVNDSGVKGVSNIFTVKKSTTPPPQNTALSLSTNSIFTAKIGELYQAEFKANGGNPPYTWEIVSGKLPNGVNLIFPPQPLASACPQPTCGTFKNDTVYVQGTPTESGFFSFSLKLSDTQTNQATGTYTIQVKPVTTPPNLGNSLKDLIPGQSNFKLSGNQTVYFYNQNSFKQAYSSMAMLKAWNVDQASIIVLPKDIVLPATDPVNPIVKLPNGVVVKATGQQVYLVENGKLRPFASLAVFISRGYKLQDIITFPPSDLKPYEIGEVIK